LGEDFGCVRGGLPDGEGEGDGEIVVGFGVAIAGAEAQEFLAECGPVV
jgi:hypothetical protein